MAIQTKAFLVTRLKCPFPERETFLSGLQRWKKPFQIHLLMVSHFSTFQCINVVVTEILNSGDFTHIINLSHLALYKYKYVFETQGYAPRTTLFLLVYNTLQYTSHYFIFLDYKYIYIPHSPPRIFNFICWKHCRKDCVTSCVHWKYELDWIKK